MTGAPDDPAEAAAELARIRAAAAEEVVRLQTALRETAAHAAQQDREVERLAGELQKAAGPQAARRRGGLQRGRPKPGRGEQDTAGALERVLATFERERKQLEERARAVAATETRQRAAETNLVAEAGRLAELERQLREINEAGAAPQAARARFAELERVEQARRDAEAELARRRDQLEADARAERLIRDRAGPSEELVARERELARREAEVTRRELQLSLVRRRVGEEERRLQERAWRAGALPQRARAPLVARGPHDVTFSEGWRLLAGRESDERGDQGGGSW